MLIYLHTSPCLTLISHRTNTLISLVSAHFFCAAMGGQWSLWTGVPQGCPKVWAFMKPSLTSWALLSVSPFSRRTDLSPWSPSDEIWICSAFPLWEAKCTNHRTHVITFSLGSVRCHHFAGVSGDRTEQTLEKNWNINVENSFPGCHWEPMAKELIINIQSSQLLAQGDVCFSLNKTTLPGNWRSEGQSLNVSWTPTRPWPSSPCRLSPFT